MAAPVAWTDAFAGLYRWDAEAAIIFVGHLSYALTMDMDPDTVVNLILDNFVVVLPFADARIQKMLREERAKLQYRMWGRRFYEVHVRPQVHAWNAAHPGQPYNILTMAQCTAMWTTYIQNRQDIVGRMLQSLSSAIDVDASIDTPRLHDHFVAVFAAAAGIVAANLDQLVWWDEGLALRKGFYEHIRAQANLLTLAGALDVDDLPLGTHIEWAHDDEYDSDDDGGDDPEDSDFDEDNQNEGEEGVEEQGEVDEEEDVLDEPEEEEAVLTDDEAAAGSDEDDG